jgi:hypothetical protein
VVLQLQDARAAMLQSFRTGDEEDSEYDRIFSRECAHR